MKLNDSILFKGFKKELLNKFGDEKTSFIWKDAQTYLQDLEKNYPDLKKKESIFPAVALYRAIEKHASGEALPFIRDYGTKIGLKVGNIIKVITALPGVPNLLWKKMDVVANKMSSGYECKDVILTKHQLKMNVIGCPLYDGAKKLGTPEAAQLFCCMDKVYMTKMRGVAYQRTKSIAEGDDVCDYQLTDSR